MKVRVLLLVVTVASLLAALVCASGAIISRGGDPGSQGIIPAGPQATGVIVNRGSYQATGAIVIGPGPRA
jgi:hypothetical protein